MHIHRRSLRHATRIILAVWLFALGAGVANACLLSEPDHGGHDSSTVSPHHESVAQGHHRAQSDPVDAGCLRFCDEAPLAITKVDQPLADGSSGWVGVLSRAAAPTMATPTAVQLRIHATRPPHMASPIAARPHRLTL